MTERQELEELLQNTGDGIANLFTQLMKGNWVDDHGHDVKLNKAMVDMKKVIVDIMKFREKYLNYETITNG